jgi:hypothetical protein
MEPTPSMSFMQAMLAYVVIPLLPVLGTVLVALMGKAIAYLHTRQKESKAALVAGTFLEAAKSIVAELEVTLRPKIQAMLADGTLTADEGLVLKTEAMNLLKTRLPATLLQSASGMFGGLLDTWLGGLVERANAAQAPIEPAPPQ